MQNLFMLCIASSRLGLLLFKAKFAHKIWIIGIRFCFMSPFLANFALYPVCGWWWDIQLTTVNAVMFFFILLSEVASSASDGTASVVCFFDFADDLFCLPLTGALFLTAGCSFCFDFFWLLSVHWESLHNGVTYNTSLAQFLFQCQMPGYVH